MQRPFDLENLSTQSSWKIHALTGGPLAEPERQCTQEGGFPERTAIEFVPLASSVCANAQMPSHD